MSRNKQNLYGLILLLALLPIVEPHSGISADKTDTGATNSSVSVPSDTASVTPVADNIAGKQTEAELHKSKDLPASNSAVEPSHADSVKCEVRIVGVNTDVAVRYRSIIPPFPIPPFTQWRQWFRDHETSMHCALEWRNESGQWFHGEMRSTHFDLNVAQYQVGGGEFPGTGFEAYGIYIMPGRVPRDFYKGAPIIVLLDEVENCDYRDVEREIRNYGARNAHSGSPGTGGIGKQNVGLGGPAYKPAQNSNTMIKYVLRACGVNREAPEKAIGWDTEPQFPYSSDADQPSLDSQP